jgi:hypothetical protein
MSFYFNNSGIEKANNQDEIVSESMVEKDHAELRGDNIQPSGYRLEGYSIIGKDSSISTPKGLTVAALERLYFTNPIRFLKVLGDISPFLSSTVTTVLRLAIGNGKFNITVREASGKNKILEEESKEAKLLFDSQPKETGDLCVVIGKLLQEIMFWADGFAFEGTFAEDDEDGDRGYSRLHLFSTNTTNLGRDKNNKRVLVQKKKDGKLIELNEFHVYWQPNDPTVDSPNGKYALASALIEGFGELITSRDLRDGVKGAGNPARVVTYDRDGLFKTAIETLGLGIRSNKVAEWVSAQVSKIETYASKRKNAEVMVVAKDVAVSNVQPANFANVVPALETLWTRFAASLNSFNNILGFGESTKASLQYQLVATNIDSKREEVLRKLCDFLVMHFKLQGKNVIVEIDAPTIHLTDELVAQNTAQMRFLNKLMEYAMGLISREEFSTEITSHLPAGEEIEGALEAILKIAKSGGNDKNDSKKTESSGGKTGGQTK